MIVIDATSRGMEGNVWYKNGRRAEESSNDTGNGREVEAEEKMEPDIYVLLLFCFFVGWFII